MAEVLARLDLPAALKVLEDLEGVARKSDQVDRSYVFHRFLGHIAYKLAARSPADAERVLERLPIGERTDRYVVGACTAMAPKDMARARRLAETRISRVAPAYRSQALGLMARAIAATDKPAAIGLIDEAYRILDRLAAVGERPTYPGLVEVAAGLLPIVEQVEPDRLGEFLGRTLALRPARGDQTDSDEAANAGTTASLAMMVARYDRTLATRLLEPELRKSGTRPSSFGMDYVKLAHPGGPGPGRPETGRRGRRGPPRRPRPRHRPPGDQEPGPHLRRQGAGLPRRRTLAARVRIFPLFLDPRSAVSLMIGSLDAGIA